MANAAKILRAMRALRLCRRGAVSVEYGLIAALVAMAVVGSLNIVGDNLSTKFDQIGHAMSDAPLPSPRP